MKKICSIPILAVLTMILIVPMGARAQASPSPSNRPSIRDRIRADIKSRNENIKINQGVRNNLMFETQKNNLINQLDRALINLKQIRSRISQRITKSESNGLDMTSVNNLLAIADAKITTADTAISNLENVEPTVGTGATAAPNADPETTTLDLSGPRQAGATAIAAIHDAERALNSTLVALAHSIGLSTGPDGTIMTGSATSGATESPTATP